MTKFFFRNHSLKDFTLHFNVLDYFFNGISFNWYHWIKTLETNNKFFPSFYTLEKVDTDILWPQMIFKQFMPTKIFIFRMHYRENNVGKFIHQENPKFLKIYLILLNPLNSKLREASKKKERTGFILLKLFLILLNLLKILLKGVLFFFFFFNF